MKVYCKDCEYWNTSTSTLGSPLPSYIPSSCDYKKKIEWYDTPICQKQVITYADSRKDNIKNNCKYYKPSIWKRITTWFKGIR